MRGLGQAGPLTHLLEITVTLDELMATTFKPTKKDIQVVMSGVFGISSCDAYSPLEAMVVMAYKILRDTGHDVEHLLASLQYFLEDIIAWEHDGCRVPLTFMIVNNRYASVFSLPARKRLYDLREFRQVELMDELLLLQVLVGLSGLYALAGGKLPHQLRSPPAAESAEAAQSASPDCS